MITNTTVMFQARSQTPLSFGDIVDVTAIQRSSPVVALNGNGKAIVAHDAPSKGLLWCFGFGHIENSEGELIERPFTDNPDADINDLLGRLNVSDIAAQETHTLSGLAGSVTIGDSLPFTDYTSGAVTMAANALSFSEGVWAVAFEAVGEGLHADLYRDNAMQSHAPEVGDFKGMRSTAIIVAAGGAPLKLVASSDASVTESTCICYRLS
jgi:hypothetical protein